MILNEEKLKKIVSNANDVCDSHHECDGCPYRSVKPYCRVAMFVDAGIELAYVDEYESYITKKNDRIKEDYNGPRGSFKY